MLNQLGTFFLLGLLLLFSIFLLVSLERDFAEDGTRAYGFLATSKHEEILQIQNELKNRFAEISIKLLPSQGEKPPSIIAIHFPKPIEVSRIKAYLRTIDNIEEWIFDSDFHSVLHSNQSRIRWVLWLLFSIIFSLIVLKLMAQLKINNSLRRHEIEVWRQLGASGTQVFWHFVFPQFIIPTTGLLLAILMASSTFWFAPKLFQIGLAKSSFEISLFETVARQQQNRKIDPVKIENYNQAADKQKLYPPLSNFWNRKRFRNQEEQQGLILEASPGEPVSSTFDGTVVFDGQLNKLGRMVIIDHGNGLHSVYAHLGEIKTRLDERLQRGQVFGYIGDNVFYFEFRQNGKTKPIEQFF